MSTYLSIDLDFWQKSSRYAWKFYKEAVNHSDTIPLTVVVSHEELVSHIIDLHPGKLINVDYHDDIILHSAYLADDESYANYNWVNECLKHGVQAYEWYHPCQDEGYDYWFGLCDREKETWDNPLFPYRISCYDGLPCLTWNEICGIGISLSPGFTVSHHVKRILRDLNEDLRIYTWPNILMPERRIDYVSP